MPDPNLIRNPVQAARSSSGVGPNYNVAAIGAVGESISGAIGSAQVLQGAREGQRRSLEQNKQKLLRIENEEVAESDMVEYTAYLNTTKKEFDQAIMKTSDAAAIEKLTSKYDKAVTDYIGNDKIMRNKMSRNAASTYYKKNKAGIFDNPAANRISNLTRRENAAKLQFGIEDAEKNVSNSDPQLTEKQFNLKIESQIKDLYQKQVNSGEYLPAEAKLLVQRSIDTRYLNMAKLDTATLENEINIDAKYAEDTIGRIKNNKMLSTADRAEGVRQAINQYEMDVKEEKALYEEKIGAIPLDEDIARKFLARVDVNMSANFSYLKTLSKKLDTAKTEFQTQNENSIRLWGLNLDNVDKVFPLHDWKDNAGNKNKGLLSLYKNGDISQSFYDSEIKRLTGKKVTEKEVINSTNAFEQFNRSFGNVKPSSTVEEINNRWKVIDRMQGWQKTQSTKRLLNQTALYDKEFEAMKKEVSADFETMFEKGFTIDVPDVWSHTDVEKFLAADILFEIEEEARAIFRSKEPEQGPKAAKLFLRDRLKQGQDERSGNKIFYQYIKPDVLKGAAIQRQIYEKDIIGAKITEQIVEDTNTGDKYYVDEETGATRRFHEGTKGITNRRAKAAMENRVIRKKEPTINVNESDRERATRLLNEAL